MKRIRKWADRRQLFLYLATIGFAVLFLWAGNRMASRDLAVFKAGNRVPGIPTRVTEITGEDVLVSETGGVRFERQVVYFEGIVRSGIYRGLIIEGRQIEDPFAPIPMKQVEAGDKVLLYALEQDADGVTTWVLQEYIRSDALIALAVFFCRSVAAVWQKKGLSHHCIAAAYLPGNFCGAHSSGIVGL